MNISTKGFEKDKSLKVLDRDCEIDGRVISIDLRCFKVRPIIADIRNSRVASIGDYKWCIKV